MLTIPMVAFGLATAFVWQDLPNGVGGAVVALHLLLICGLPAAIGLGRTGSEALVFAVLCSFGITTLAAQPLVWLTSFSTRTLLIEATILGAAVGVLSEGLTRRPTT